MYRFLGILFILLSFSLCGYCYDLDVSVNSDIEQKYDSNKLKNEMGVSSAPVKKSTKKAPKSTPVFDASTPTVSSSKSGVSNTVKSGPKIPSGTKFAVKSMTSVSGWSGVNSQLSFTSTAPVSKNGVTIPSGTVFKGVVSDSHAGQITGNGGLIEINLISMVYNGKNIQIEGVITKANSKNVFLNNIKGKRQYIANVGNQLKKGVNIYNKVQSISSVIPNNPLNKVLSPVTAVVGAAGTLTNTVISPVVAVFKKGQNISLPAGTVFEIKLTKDVYLN